MKTLVLFKLQKGVNNISHTVECVDKPPITKGALYMPSSQQMDQKGPKPRQDFIGDVMLMMMMYQSEARPSIYLCAPLCVCVSFVFHPDPANPKTTEPWHEYLFLSLLDTFDRLLRARRLPPVRPHCHVFGWMVDGEPYMSRRRRRRATQ